MSKQEKRQSQQNKEVGNSPSIKFLIYLGTFEVKMKPDYPMTYDKNLMLGVYYFRPSS